MTRDLFKKFTHEDKPLYFEDEDIKDVPYGALADRMNALNVLDARLHSIRTVANSCKVELDDEGVDVKRLVLDTPIGDAPFDVDKDYNVDRIALRSLMGSYWFVQKELNELIRELRSYIGELRDEARHRDPWGIRPSLEYHFAEGDYVLYEYARKEAEE